MSKLELPKVTIQQVFFHRRTCVKRRVILWLILSIIALGISWLVFAKVEPVVYLKGKLKGQEIVRKLQLPQDSIIDQIYIKKGEKVTQGQQLLSFYITNYLTKLKNLETLQQSLREENQFYKNVMNKSIEAALAEEGIAKLKLPQERIALVKNKMDLIEANQRLKEQIVQEKKQVALINQQLETLETNQSTPSSPQTLSSKEKSQQRIEQINNQLRLLEKQLNEEQKRLEMIKNLVAEESLSYLRYIEQQETVKSIQDKINQLNLELDNLYLIAKPQEEADNKKTIQKQKQELINEISHHQNQIILLQKQIINQENQSGEIDSQFNQYILENQTKIDNINSQIKQYRKNIKSNLLHSPISGLVTQLNLTHKSDIYLEIIPENKLNVEAYMPYKDHKLIGEKMAVEVTINSLGKQTTIPGKIVMIGTDLLSPNEVYPFFRFPVQISLETNKIKSDNPEIVLQSDMKVTVKCPITQQRTVLEVFSQNILFKIHQIQNRGRI